MIGAEVESGGKAVSAGWAEDIPADTLNHWKERGLELQPELERIVQQTTADEYSRLMRKRLGLRKQDPTDESQLFKPLLELMERHKLDFHSTFRTLTSFRPSVLGDEGALQKLVSKLLAATPDSDKLDHTAATAEWLMWLEAYARRIEDEKAEWSGVTDVDSERERETKLANPRFVLRQWVLEEVIAKVERDADSGKRVLAKVMHVSFFFVSFS